ncbi:MAG: SDR family NAD(P)-dependent oxidoreductase, partial [Myxococcota bacterium]
RDKVAVVTGAASGIGRGMAECFAEAGMKLVLADVEEAGLEKTAEALGSGGAELLSLRVDVSQPAQVEALAQQAIERFGAVHLLCNNAGVATGGVPTWESTLEDWQWVIGVNLMGVIHGIRSFLPRMIEHGEEAHVVNTASIAGLVTGGGNAIYSVTKHAVVALSESLHNELAAHQSKVKMSVLCPGWVNTAIFEAARNRPPELANAAERPLGAEAQLAHKFMLEQAAKGLDPRQVGEIVLDAVRAERFYILTHPDWKNMIQNRMDNILGDRDPTPLPPPGMENFFRKG